MRVTLSKLLAVYIMVSSVSWPVLSYYEQHEERTHLPVQLELGKLAMALELIDSPDPTDNDSGCDHCCHLALHLLGCFMSYQDPAPVNPGPPLLFTHNNYNSLFPSPPYHPPTA